MALLLNTGNTVSRSYTIIKPSPIHPIQPQETGERTGNLLKNEQTQTVVENNGITFTRNSDGSITANGTATARAKYQYYGLGAWKYAYDTDYFLSGCPTGGSTNTYSLLIDSTAMQFRDAGNGKLVNVPSSGTGTYNFEIRIESGATVDNLVFRPMLNSGTTPLPYEPYGYKIPISSANTTTPVYLGEVETTRKIKKYIFDGSNIFTTQRTSYRNNTALFATTVMTGAGITDRPSMNNYFVVPSSGINPQSLDYACSGFNPYYQFSGYYYLRVPYDVIGMTDSNTDNEFITALNTWLSSLYNSGNPMIAYYALETPETAVVNEPLRKIGDYADEVSNVSIPTIAGANTIDVDTTLKPSEVTATYKGWHPVSAVHEKSMNLYNINAKDVNNGYVNDAQISQDGTTSTWGSAEISEYIPISGDTEYTFNGIGSYNSPCYALYDENKQLIGTYKYNGASIINFISPNNARYFRFTHIKSYTQAMMVEGKYSSSTMPEYEPYWT